MHLVFEGNRVVDLRLAEDFSEAEREQPRDDADKHAARREPPEPRGMRSPSVAGEAEQVAAIMHELVHIHARNDRGGAFLNSDKIDRQQQDTGEDQPGKAVRAREAEPVGLWG